MIPSPEEARIAVVVYPGVSELDLGALLSGAAAPGLPAALTVARSRQSLRAAAGLIFTPGLMYAAVPAVRAVLIPSGDLGALNRLARDPHTTRFLQEQLRRGSVLAACGSGALLLARAGFLLGAEVGTDAQASQELQGALLDAGARQLRPGELVPHGSLLTGPGGLHALELAARLRDRVYMPAPPR